MHLLNKKLLIKTRLRAIAFLVCSAPFFAYGDLVNKSEITTFVDGQPAVAAQVNGNFQELINQIDDNASRIIGIEGFAGSILTTGDDTKEADCTGDGPQALQSVIGSASNHTSRLTIIVTGECDPVSIVDRSEVVIQGGTIKGNPDTQDTLIIQSSSVQLNGTNVDANGGGNGINATRSAFVILVGASVTGGGQSQILMGSSQVLFLGGNNVIGTDGDNATGLDLFASQAYLTTVDGITTSTLAINSSGTAMVLTDSLFQALELVPGSTTLTIPNASDVAFEGTSVGYLSQSAITVSDRFSVTDNSAVTVEGFGAGETFTLNGNVRVDRGGVLRFDLEEDPIDISVVHTGDIEVSLNSVLDAFGVIAAPSALALASGDGEISVALNGSFVTNSAIVAADSISIFNGSVILAENTSFSGAQPIINVLYDGTFADLGVGAGILTGDVTQCSFGGNAYTNDPNDPLACP